VLDVDLAAIAHGVDVSAGIGHRRHYRLTARQMVASLDCAATRAARALRLSGSGLRALSFAAVIGQ
jgi:hypothetical protein